MAYTPGSFGHPAPLPAVFAGFGLDPFVYWRGNGNELDRLADVSRAPVVLMNGIDHMLPEAQSPEGISAHLACGSWRTATPATSKGPHEQSSWGPFGCFHLSGVPRRAASST